MDFSFLRQTAFALLACSTLAVGVRAQEADKAVKKAQEMKVASLLGEAQSLQNRKRYVDAFGRLDEAEAIDPKRAEIYNIRGAILMAAPVRDLPAAREQFNKALALKPDDMPPYFNLAEVTFVGGQWPECEKAFAEMLVKFPKLPTPVRHMILFKQLVALVKQEKFEAAEKLLAGSFGFMDDTPAYYYSKAVIAFQKKDDKTANEWLTKGQLIFKGDASYPYLDSLMESHYIDSLAVGKADESEGK